MRQLVEGCSWLFTNVAGFYDMIQNPYRNFCAQQDPTQGFASFELQEKVCIVTGANAGIGLETARLLKRHGAVVIMACRDRNRAAAAAKDLEHAESFPGCKEGRIEIMEVDLASLASVRSFCSQFNSRRLPLHLLVCNAGIMTPPTRQQTVDGLELQVQVNHLSHWLMAQQLLGEQRRRRKAGKPTGAYSDKARVVFLTSVMHRCGRVALPDINAEQRYVPFFSYGVSKLANILSAKELQRRFSRNPEYGEDVAVAVSPGIANTHLANGFFTGECWSGYPGFLRPALSGIMRVMIPWLSLTPEASAAGVVKAAVADGRKVAGEFMAHGRVCKPDAAALDDELSGWLWEWSSRLTGLDTDPSLAMV